MTFSLSQWSSFVVLFTLFSSWECEWVGRKKVLGSFLPTTAAVGVRTENLFSELCILETFTHGHAYIDSILLLCVSGWSSHKNSKVKGRMSWYKFLGFYVVGGGGERKTFILFSYTKSVSFERWEVRGTKILLCFSLSRFIYRQTIIEVHFLKL